MIAALGHRAWYRHPRHEDRPFCSDRDSSSCSRSTWSSSSDPRQERIVHRSLSLQKREAIDSHALSFIRIRFVLEKRHQFASSLRCARQVVNRIVREHVFERSDFILSESLHWRRRSVEASKTRFQSSMKEHVVCSVSPSRYVSNMYIYFLLVCFWNWYRQSNSLLTELLKFTNHSFTLRISTTMMWCNPSLIEKLIAAKTIRAGTCIQVLLLWREYLLNHL